MEMQEFHPEDDLFIDDTLLPPVTPNKQLSVSDGMLFLPELCPSEIVLMSKMLLKCRQDAIDLALETCGVPLPYDWRALINDRGCVESLIRRGLSSDAIAIITCCLPADCDAAEHDVQVPGIFEDVTLYADTVRKVNRLEDRACFVNIFKFVFRVDAN